MIFENGEWWRPIDPDKRGRHATFSGALDAVFAELGVERNDFYDSLVDRWRELFPTLAARPGRYEAGNPPKIFLYVKNAPTNFAIRPRLPAIKRQLAALPGSPKRFDLKLEIHAC